MQSCVFSDIPEDRRQAILKIRRGEYPSSWTWWKVLGFGGFSGPVRKSQQDAFRAWVRAMRKKRVSWDRLTSAWSQGACRFVVGRTRRAVERADFSSWCDDDWTQVSPQVAPPPWEILYED